MACMVSDEETAHLEIVIDQMDALIPPLNSFILPGGCRGNALAHVCRTVCRRAERCMNKINRSGGVDEKALKYINRLSDYFFILSRKQNFVNNINEIIWKNPCK